MQQPYVVAMRRDLHAHPELGFAEFRTCAVIAQQLTDFGWSVSVGADVLDPALRMGVPTADVLEEGWSAALAAGVPATRLEAMRGGLTAVAATLIGNRPGKVVAVRADIDALPVLESSDAAHAPTALGFASARPGVMHACGHDGHIAIALDLARRLADRDFPGTVKLLFQPAEEGLRGGRSVAMSGLLDDVDDLLCLHLGVGLPTGTVSTDTVGSLASAKMRATFDGIASHAGLAPERGRSALLAAAAATLAVHSMPQHGSASVRANVGSLHADGAANVVPARAVMTLEVRGDHSEACAELLDRVETALHGSAATYGVACTVDMIGQAPAVVSDDTLAADLASIAARVPSVREVRRGGVDNGSDDASWLMDRVHARGGRAIYALIGSSPNAHHHESTFDLDEESLTIGSDLLYAAIRSLS